MATHRGLPIGHIAGVHDTRRPRVQWDGRKTSERQDESRPCLSGVLRVLSCSTDEQITWSQLTLCTQQQVKEVRDGPHSTPGNVAARHERLRQDENEPPRS